MIEEMLSPSTSVPMTANETHRVDFLEFDLATQDSSAAVNSANLVSSPAARNGAPAYGSTETPAIGSQRSSGLFISSAHACVHHLAIH